MSAAEVAHRDSQGVDMEASDYRPSEQAFVRRSSNTGKTGKTPGKPVNAVKGGRSAKNFSAIE
jgi:hypothetical protein